jgi:hypothetical protein
MKVENPMNIWRVKTDARQLTVGPYLIYNVTDGWMVAGWNGYHFAINHQTHYALDDVDAVFELPHGSDCPHCRIPTDVIRCKKSDQILLRCAQCGHLIETEPA